MVECCLQTQPLLGRRSDACSECQLSSYLDLDDCGVRADCLDTQCFCEREETASWMEAMPVLHLQQFQINQNPRMRRQTWKKKLLLDLKYQRVHPRADSHFREEEAASPSLSGVCRARTLETRGEISGTDAPAVRSHFSLLTEGRLCLLAASA